MDSHPLSQLKIMEEGKYIQVKTDNFGFVIGEIFVISMSFCKWRHEYNTEENSTNI